MVKCKKNPGERDCPPLPGKKTQSVGWPARHLAVTHNPSASSAPHPASCPCPLVRCRGQCLLCVHLGTEPTTCNSVLCGETGSQCWGQSMSLEFSTQPLGREQAFPDTEDSRSWPTRKAVPTGELLPAWKWIRQLSGSWDWAGTGERMLRKSGSIGWWRCSGVSSVMVVQHCEFTGSHQIVHFKMVKIMNFMLCESYLNDNKKWIQEQDVENKSSSEKNFKFTVNNIYWL